MFERGLAAHGLHIASRLRESSLFLGVLGLCLSRACLGKMIISSIQRHQKGRVSHLLAEDADLMNQIADDLIAARLVSLRA